MKLTELFRAAKTQGKRNICRFMVDMRRAGIRMSYYQGRFFWKGPAVEVSNIQKVLNNTKVRCQWDNMGLDFVVYPVESL